MGDTYSEQLTVLNQRIEDLTQSVFDRIEILMLSVSDLQGGLVAHLMSSHGAVMKDVGTQTGSAAWPSLDETSATTPWKSMGPSAKRDLLLRLHDWLPEEAASHGVSALLPRQWYQWDGFVEQARLLLHWQHSVYGPDGSPAAALEWHDAFRRQADEVWKRYAHRPPDGSEPALRTDGDAEDSFNKFLQSLDGTHH